MSVRRGTPFVVSAPSGTGKTSVCRRVVERDPQIEFSVSHTTRRPRPEEREGIDYHFVTTEEFRALVDRNAFVEHAVYGGNQYGTSWSSLDGPLDRGQDLLLEIEVQGAGQIKEAIDEAILIFIRPPSRAVLVERLRSRGDTTAVDVADRHGEGPIAGNVEARLGEGPVPEPQKYRQVG